MNPLTKAVLPVAGLGTRFLPATKAQPKEMLPLLDKPAIQLVVEEATAAGLDDLLLVTGRAKRAIEDHFDRSFSLESALAARGEDTRLAEVLEPTRLARMHFVRQGEARGLGDAVLLAKSHVGAESFAVLLGDDLLPTPSKVLRRMVQLHADHGKAVLALKRVAREAISSYGCAAVEPFDEGVFKVTQLVEKPAWTEAPSDLAVIGRYVLPPSVFEALESLDPGRNGEVQLTDALSKLVESEGVLAIEVDETHHDIGDKVGYFKAFVHYGLRRRDLGVDMASVVAEALAEYEASQSVS